jgi:hypothetical protein
MHETIEPTLTAQLGIQYAGNLAQARTDLSTMSRLHADFVAAGLAAIDAKKQRLGGPVTGEIFPHLVAKGLTLADADRRMLAAAWLALYGYTCLVDYELDQTGVLDARSSIAASALLSWGIATFGRYTAGTPFAESFLDNVNRAFAGQYADLARRAESGADRQTSDADKGRAPLAAIAGFCAAAGMTDDRLVRAAEAMLAPHQIFDDLEDLEEDLGENNLTVFARVVRAEGAAAITADRLAMYRTLIGAPATLLPLRQAAAAIDAALLLLDADRDVALVDYLARLRTANAALIDGLVAYQRSPREIGEPELLERIARIATSC